MTPGLLTRPSGTGLSAPSGTLAEPAPLQRLQSAVGAQRHEKAWGEHRRCLAHVLTEQSPFHSVA
jgi:hypothetical protein